VRCFFFFWVVVTIWNANFDWTRSFFGGFPNASVDWARFFFGFPQDRSPALQALLSSVASCILSSVAFLLLADCAAACFTQNQSNYSCWCSCFFFVFVFFVAVVDALVSVPLVASIVGHILLAVVHIQVVVVSVIVVYSFSPSFLSPNVLLLLLLFVVPVNYRMGPGYGCHHPLQDYHCFCCCC